jgi:hypothetical protein
MEKKIAKPKFKKGDKVKVPTSNRLAPDLVGRKGEVLAWWASRPQSGPVQKSGDTLVSPPVYAVTLEGQTDWVAFFEDALIPAE